jgi:hypothetical protein
MYFDNENYRKVPYTSINTEARLGYFVSIDTFPALVYELKSLNKDDPKATIMIEMLKAVIETKEPRGTMNKQSTIKTRCPAFRQINFSSSLVRMIEKISTIYNEIDIGAGLKNPF